MWIWIAAAVLTLLLGLAAAWWFDRLGGNRLDDPAEAERRLAELFAATSPYADVAIEMPALPAAPASAPPDAGAEPELEGGARMPSAGSGMAPALDAVIPGALSLGVGLYAWATPDQAVLDAVAQVSGDSVTNALDLHQVIGEHGYDVMSHGSLIKWRGHVFENQVREQVESWAPDGSFELADASNYPGADATIFGRPFQMKTNADFNSIDNVHGDPLIVADGTANLPEDAITIDFADPGLDPSMLDGHDVIVAQGLDAAGAAGAWDDALGGLADGVDVADFGDLAGDLAIPGVGSAIRVVSTGAKRRAALGEERTRAEAGRRVAQDAAEGVSLAVALGFVGGAAGFVVDMFGGMGAGTYLGSAAGTALGGYIAGKRSRGRDSRAVAAARDRTVAAVAAYGQAAEASTDEATRAWRARVEQEQTRLAGVLERRRAELATIRRCALRDLDTATEMTPGEREAFARESMPALRRGSAGWSRTALRLRRHWLAVTDALVAAHGSATTRDALLLAVAVPGGQERVAAWLDGVSRYRAVLVSAADCAMADVVTQSVRDRQAALARLGGQREDLLADMDAELRPLLDRVSRASAQLEDQLSIAGHRP